MPSLVTLSVPSMTCEHCVSTIRKALQGLGLPEAQIDLKFREIRVETSVSAVPSILATLSAEGYPASSR